jgi:hypothetical protein
MNDTRFFKLIHLLFSFNRRLLGHPSARTPMNAHGFSVEEHQILHQKSKSGISARRLIPDFFYP